MLRDDERAELRHVRVAVAAAGSSGYGGAAELLRADREQHLLSQPRARQPIALPGSPG